MICTEEEAKTKWCRFALSAPTNSNRFDDGTARPECFCVASKCMAWEWLLTNHGKRKQKHGTLTKDELRGALGYCGHGKS